MKLFAIYIGGEFKNANIELHDMRFILAKSIEETYSELRRQWWGIPHTLHLDCWSELSQADGYKITLERTPSNETNKLFYVNLGGYNPNHFTEMHKNMFVVAETESKAKVRALKTVRHWNIFHKDDVFEAEQSFCINNCGQEQGWYIHLEKIEDESPAPFICNYKNIGKNSK
jgi:hypothetical protein